MGDWSPASGYRVGLQLAGDLEVTAIFVANDQMALGVLRALHERGREIPREVSIVGFDDIPEAAYFAPPLTTAAHDVLRDPAGKGSGDLSRGAGAEVFQRFPRDERGVWGDQHARVVPDTRVRWRGLPI